MSIKRFEKVIATVLRQNMGKGKTVEQVASAIVTRVDEVESILAEVGVDIPTLGAPEPLKAQDWGSIAEQVAPGRVDISAKLTPSEKVEEGLVERWTKERLQDFAKNEMSSELEVRPPGFDEVLKLEKKIESAPGDLAYVRIMYNVKGNPQQMFPIVQVSSTDVRLDAAALTEEIYAQAMGMFSRVPKVLVPKAPPRIGSLGDLTQGIGVDLDTRENPITGGELPGGITQDGRVVVGEMGRSWKQQGGR